MSGAENKASELSQAIISYLARSGICVCPCRTSPRQKAPGGRFPALGLFGIPLHLLRPSQHVEGVPEFLVEACELLRPHLHTEGLFRKCGSTTRIKALKVRLDAGERCLHMALPCDVATLVKLFLRSLPEPLISAELQGPLCQVQQQSREDDDQDSRTLLLTCLLPPSNSSVLRYFMSFLQEVVARCAQNKMDLANLAIIFVPNLFSGETSSQGGISKAEERLRTQVAVTQLLISRALEIGTIPEPLRDKIHAAVSDLESKGPCQRGQGEAAESRTAGRRRHRRSVSYMVNEALNKFRTCRTVCITPDLGMKQEPQGSPVLKISFGSKRKASEEVVAVTELSIKKRRSDLGITSSDPFDGNGGASFDQPADFTSVQGSSGTPTGKVQRKQSSSRKRSRRKSTIPASRSFSPSLTERKQTGHKSFNIFSGNSKDQPSSQPPHPLSAKGADPSGWFPLKKRRQEAGDLTMILPQRACLQSYKVQEDHGGSPSCSPSGNASARISFIPRAFAEVKSRRPAEARPYFEVLSSWPSGQDAGTPLGKRGWLAKMEALAETSRHGIALAMCHKALRRSLSWPEELSLRDATDESNFSPEEAPISPGEQEDLGPAEPAQPGMKDVISGMKQLRVQLACVAPAENLMAASSGDESYNLSPRLSPPKLEVLETGGNLTGQVSQTPAGQLAVNFQGAPVPSNEEPQISILTSPKSKSRRRFGRSVSHESGLPLQGGVSKGGESRPPPKNPLQQLKACGRQFFISHKHIRSSLAGLWVRKEGHGPPADPPDQQTSLLSEDDQLPHSCSPPNLAGEM
ncbi:rho GTPase-activating protein 11A-like [Crotalus adamanteus]|uniref:Rho GTPase-activating protein 11A-like n=1 Tax=Crotalus adamanteus TaxID=8729 RepID=A0AAW1AX18_CROAD